MNENSKKKKLLRIGIVLLIVIAVLWLLTSYFFGKQVYQSSTQLSDPEETGFPSEGFWKKYDISYDAFCEAFTIEKVWLTSSFDGHRIPAEFIYSEEITQDTVILCHGLGGNRYSNYPVAELFLVNGYNVITYDQRSTNENTAEKTTFGYWEKYDLIDCISYAKERTDERYIGVWGTSFGGATAVQAVAYENTQEDLSFLILDCPVSSMEWMIDREIKDMGLGNFSSYITGWGNLINRKELGFSYQDADSAEAAKRITIPTLVINSKADQVTPYFMGEEIYRNLSSDRKELWTVPDSEHTGMWLDYHQEYEDRLLRLLNELEQ